MPDNVHLLVYYEDEKLTISKIIQNIKSHTGRDFIHYYKKMGSREPLLSARVDNPAWSRGSMLPKEIIIYNLLTNMSFFCYDFKSSFDVNINKNIVLFLPS